MVVPQSPEVDTFRCGHCGHEWSAPAAPVRADIPEEALPQAGVVNAILIACLLVWAAREQ